MPPVSCETQPRQPAPADVVPDGAVHIGARAVGPGCRTYVIAEAGVNHDGCADQALRLVDAAMDAGADAVKFQMFRAADLVSAQAPLAAYQRSTGSANQREMLARLELADDEFRRVREHCAHAGIEFLATPFGPRDVARLGELNVAALKTASTDIDNTPLLRTAAETGLPLIVSTGASTANEIRAAVRRFDEWGAIDRLILLHCVSSYPTPLRQANLRAVQTLHESFGIPAGYSDHTTSVDTGAWAVACGACVLEKHFTLDRGATGPDHAMSLSPPELQTYIERVRQFELAGGGGALGMCAAEAEVRQVARKSVTAACDIPAGTQLTAAMLTVKRPGGGISPDRLDEVLGRCVKREIPADTALSWDQLG